MQEKTIRWFYAAIMVGILVNAVGPCTITHKYGPYHGKVIETETGEPIDGAYVLAAYYTEMFTLGGFVSKFVETGEATTDKNGEFQIDAYRAWAFRFPQRWKKDCYITISKPGYGGYSSHEIAPQKQVIEQLRRLTTYGERWNNLGSGIPVGIPDNKLRGLRKLIDEERRNLGMNN